MLAMPKLYPGDTVKTNTDIVMHHDKNRERSDINAERARDDIVPEDPVVRIACTVYRLNGKTVHNKEQLLHTRRRPFSQHQCMRGAVKRARNVLESILIHAT